MNLQEEEQRQKSTLEAKLASFMNCGGRELLGIGKRIVGLFDAQKVEVSRFVKISEYIPKVEDPFSGLAQEPGIMVMVSWRQGNEEIETKGNEAEVKWPNIPDKKLNDKLKEIFGGLTQSRPSPQV